MAVRCGIDLGTTYSAISWYDPQNKRVSTIELDHVDGKKLTPSVVYFEDGGNVVIGETAVNASLQHPDRVVIGIKRSMGDDYKVPPIDGVEYTPEQISAKILEALKVDAETAIGETVADVVISVPAYFGDRQRVATQEAAQLAGLNVLEIIDEPHAAALAYAIDNAADIVDRNVIVYDLGGGTFDVTLVATNIESLDSGQKRLNISTLATEGDRHLGGLDWDDVLADMLAERAEAIHSIDNPRLDARTDAMLMKNTEAAKRNLSRVKSTATIVDFQAHQVNVTREEFEDRTRDLMMRAEMLVESVLSEAENQHNLLTEKRIQELVATGTPRAELEDRKIRLLLCGGSTRMPMIQDCVTRIMGESPLKHGNPDLLVTIGAAYRAYLISDPDALSDMNTDGDGAGPVVSVGGNMITMPSPGKGLSHPIGVEVVVPDAAGNLTEYRNVPIIRHKAQPNEVFEADFPVAEDNQVEIRLNFYEGDSPDLDDCTYLASVTITGLPPGREAGCLIRIRLWYDFNGIVHGQAIDLETGQEVKIHIQR